MKPLKSILFKCFVILVVAFLVFKFAIIPVMPQSVFSFYFIVIIVGLVLFVTATTENLKEFWTPIESLLVQQRLAALRWFIFLVIPAIIGVSAGLALVPSNQAPISLRVVHPAPPGEIDFNGKKINLVEVVNPFRKLERENAAEFEKHVEAGRKVYFENCHFCHGDFLDGNGAFATALEPKPANFQDVGTIAQLQESYVFWRIAKGGPGLPNESMPWQSSMPAWESFLSEDEIWEVTLYLYKATNHHPRTWE